MHNPPRVYLTSPVNPKAQALLAEHTDLTVGTEDISREDFLRQVQNSDIVFNKLDPMTMDAELLAAAPNLKMIARHGTGYSNIDVAAATREGIVVTITPGVNTVSIAEYTMGLMLASVRNIVAAANASHQGNPERSQFMGPELQGSTFGVIGVGSIGKEVAKRAAALGMNVIAYHPRPSASKLKDLPLRLVDLPELLAQADVISLHCPLTDETRGLIGKSELAQIKPGAHIVNVSRGGIVDEAAVIEALKSGRLGGYITDVLAREPVRADNPLLAAPRAIVMPHIAAMTPTVQQNVAMTAVQDILRFARGEKPLHMVNPEAWEKAHAK